MSFCSLSARDHIRPLNFRFLFSASSVNHPTAGTASSPEWHCFNRQSSTSLGCHNHPRPVDCTQTSHMLPSTYRYEHHASSPRGCLSNTTVLPYTPSYPTITENCSWAVSQKPKINYLKGRILTKHLSGMKSNISSKYPGPPTESWILPRFDTASFALALLLKRARGQEAVAASLFISRHWVENILICIKLGVLDKTMVVVCFCWECFLCNIAYIRALKHTLCNHNPISEVLSHDQYNYPVEKKNHLAALK